MSKILFLKIIYGVVAVIIGSALFALFIGLYSQLLSSPFNIFSPFDISKIKSIEANFALAFVGTITGLVALFGGIIAIIRSGTNERETRTAEEGLITDRLNKATEGLGKKDGDDPVIEVRLGALYALERIAQDSIRDHIQIMEILCAYIRYNSPNNKKTDKKKPLREDIHAAIIIIGRRETWPNGKKRIEKEEEQEYRLELEGCYLSNAKLAKANLSRANLDYSNLKNSDLRDTNLRGAKIRFSNLDYSWLHNSDMTDAWLNGTDFIYTILDDANLSLASLGETNFENASLNGTKTNKAFAHIGNFSNCDALTQEHIDVMLCGIHLKTPDRLIRPKHWPEVLMKSMQFQTYHQEWIKEKNPYMR